MKEDVDLIFKQMGVKEAGSEIIILNFMDFVDKLEGSANLDASKDSMSGSMNSRRSHSNSAATEEILDGLRRRIQVGHGSSLSSTGSRKVSIADVENAFRSCCRDNNKQKQFIVSKSQFMNALDAVNIHIRAADVEGLFEILKIDRHSRDSDVDYRSFMDLLAGSGSGGKSIPSSPQATSPRLSRSSSKMERK